MDAKQKDCAVRTIVGLLIAAVLFFSSGVTIPGLDSSAEDYFQESIAEAGVSYGVCRLINGTVSVIQQSSIQLEPAGIGMSLAVGQIVDPINDMVERLSDVLVLSITSLGVQEIMHEISVVLAPPVMGFILVFLSFTIWCKGKTVTPLQKALQNLIIILVIARCCLAVSSIANGFLQEHFFEDRIIKANAKLSDSTVQLGSIEDVKEMPEYDGMFKTIENSAKYLKSKSSEFKKAVGVVLENKRMIVESLLQLTFLYLGVFIIQVLILPLLIFWMMVKIVNALFTRPALHD